MIYTSFSLNGAWKMGYQEEKYTEEKEPFQSLQKEEDAAGTEPESICNDRIEKAVPGYWEDMTEAFQLTSFYGKLKINPEYGIQRYPIAGNVPDMALPNIVGTFFTGVPFIGKNHLKERFYILKAYRIAFLCGLMIDL